MPLPELRLRGRRSRAQELTERLREAIHDGRLRPGERLVEDAVAAAAGISRTPVREALRRLEAEGLVEDAGRGMRGMVVSEPSSQELAELCAVREVLEGMAARLAAESRSPAEAALLQRLAGEARAAAEAGDLEALVAANRHFHETVWRAARNRYLARQLAALRGAIDRLQPTTLRLEHRRHEAVLEHERLLAAVLARDPDAAEAHARTHFRNGEVLRLALELEGGEGEGGESASGNSASGERAGAEG